MDPLMEIRKLPPSATNHLGLILDYGNQWKDLMAIIPKKLPQGNFVSDISEENPAKYTSEDIQTIDQGAQQFRKSSTVILFDEWGTSGKPRANLGHLRYLLAKANLYRAADYVSVELLKELPVPRPETGPASTIKLQYNDLSFGMGEQFDTSYIPLRNGLEGLLYKIENIALDTDVIDESSLLASNESNKTLESILNQMKYPFSDSSNISSCHQSKVAKVLEKDCGYEMYNKERKNIEVSEVTTFCARSYHQEFFDNNMNLTDTQQSISKDIQIYTDGSIPEISMLLGEEIGSRCRKEERSDLNISEQKPTLEKSTKSTIVYLDDEQKQNKMDSEIQQGHGGIINLPAFSQIWTESK